MVWRRCCRVPLAMAVVCMGSPSSSSSGRYPSAGVLGAFAVPSTSLPLRHKLRRISAPTLALLRQRGGMVTTGPATGGEESTNDAASRDISVSSVTSAGEEAALTLDYNQSSADPGSTPLSKLLTALRVDPALGLSQKDSDDRLKQYGPNALTSPPGKSLWELILEQFEDRLVQILLLVAATSAVFSYFELQSAGASEESLLRSFVEPLVILAILVLNAAVGVWQSKSAEGSLESLKKLQPSLATALREEQWVDGIDASQLVPGDIVSVRAGDKIPADIRILALRSSSLSVDESSLTGESVTVQKLPGDEGLSDPGSVVQDQRGLAFGGTMVTSGSALGLVVRTAMDTEIGKIQQGVTEARSEEQKTPLGIKLDEFGDTLTIIIGVICLAVWAVSIPKFSDPSFSNQWEGAVYYAKVAVALGVAAIPEGLPAVITLCLSLGTRRMAQRNVIVRKLPSVETLGCTSVICTDKTGTLTTNEMTAVSLVLLNGKEGGGYSVEEHKISGFSYSPIGTVDGINKDEEITNVPSGAVADIAAVSALCNDARVVGNDDAVTTTEDKNDGGKKRKKAGDVSVKAYERAGEPTEAALCVLAEKLGGASATSNSNDPSLPSALASPNVDSWRRTFVRSATLEFNRDRKSMSVLCRPVGEEEGGNRLYVKGAPNLLIQRCTHIKLRDGTVCELTGELRSEIEKKTAELATRPLRCLALAVKETDGLDQSLKNFAPAEGGDSDDADGAAGRAHPLLSDPKNYANIESGLTWVGMVGIKDPARPEVARSINVCTEAGIRVMMITGDARDTAVAIARDVNILPPKGTPEGDNVKAFEGREFFVKSEEEQLELLKSDNIVFCRAEPADKQKLVKMLQSLDEIPAMTGDGVNDAPALQQAAIGIAMGITGTEVSKEAADMVLADDNFSTIVNAVEEGRCIYANMQAFICFLISCNIGEICAILLATIAGFPEPLTAMHLLWVNLVTDGPPATALGFNPPSPDVMLQRPRPSDEPIMTRWLLTRYCLTGLYVGLATVGVFVGHYMGLGVTLTELSSWSKCGELWSPALDSMCSCSDLFQEAGRMLPQTLSLTTLVCMEMFKALSAVSVDSSLFTVGPQKNRWLLLGVTAPFLLHLLVLYSGYLGIPALGESFGVVPLSIDNWITVLEWSVPIFLVDEALKAVGRWVNKNTEEERRKQAQVSTP